MSNLKETQKKWERIEDKALTECENFMNSKSQEVGDRLKLSVQLIKESVRNKQNSLHEKVYELAVKRAFGTTKPTAKLMAG